MGRVKVRHLVVKRQKGGRALYYWQPSASLRKAGFLPRRLAERTGRIEDAIAEAEALNRELDAWRRGDAPLPVAPNTVPWLVKMYRADERYTDLKEITRDGYDYLIKTVEAWSEEAGHPPIDSVGRKEAGDFKRALQKRGTATAHHVIKMARVLFAFARDEGIIDANPFEKLRVKKPKPRRQIWTHDQVAALVANAREMNRPSVGLAALLGENLGQRITDILALGWNLFDGREIVVRQSKTDVTVSVPVTKELAGALAETKRTSTIIVVSESTSRPYQCRYFESEFAKIRAAAGLPKDLQFRDLRRTAVVRLAEAGCTIPEISAITGHDIDTTARIIETYLPRTSPMARNAIAKLEKHRRKTKVGNRSEK